MEIVDKKVFSIDDVCVKLQIVTADNDEEHFFVHLNDCVAHVSARFETIEDANACFETFLKMTPFE